MHVAVILLVVIGAGLADAADASQQWPQFRGPGARGVATDGDLPDRWSATENVRWSRDIAGRGWSSPVVWGRRVFLTLAENLGADEPPKKGLYFGGNRPDPPTSTFRWKVICLDVDTGEVLWQRLAHEGPPAGGRHLKNSYASETPVTDGKRLYAYFGNVGLFCYDLEGRPCWQRRWPPHKIRYGWGTAASPVLHDDRIYVVNDNEEDSYLVALDKVSGAEVWRVGRDEKSNWSTPFVWQNRLRTEIVTPGSGRTRAYDLAGRLLYEFGGASSITIGTPYAASGLLYVSSGYILDSKRPIYAIRPGAAGDISLAADQTSNDHIAWCQPAAAPYNPSTLVLNGLLYTLLDRGFLACYDAATGAPIYEKKRLPGGRAFTSSPWTCGGKIFCLSEYGVTYVVRAGRQFELLGRNELAADDMCMATPAVAGDRLLIRTAARIYCLANAAGGGPGGGPQAEEAP